MSQTDLAKSLAVLRNLHREGIISSTDTLDDLLELLSRSIHTRKDQELNKNSASGVDPNWRLLSYTPKGWDTVIGYNAKRFPEALDLIQADIAEGTQRDGFWCMHRCRERGITTIKVAAPMILQEEGIATVNAYPEDLLAERIGA